MFIENQIVIQSEAKEKEINFDNFVNKSLLIGHSCGVYTIDICDSRNLLVSKSYDGNVKLWNLENNILIQTYPSTKQSFGVVFSNLGNLLAFNGSGQGVEINLVDISDLTNANNIQTLIGPKIIAEGHTFSNDSKYLLSKYYDDTIRIWDCKLKVVKFQFKSKRYLNSVAFSPDDTMIVVHSSFRIHIWNLLNQKLVCSQFENGYGCAIQFSKNQRMLVSSTSFGIIKLWSLKDLNKNKLILIRKLKIKNNPIWGLQFCPYSKFIITICDEIGSITIFDLQTAQVVKSFEFNKNQQKDIAKAIRISTNIKIIAYNEGMNIVVLKQQ